MKFTAIWLLLLSDTGTEKCSQQSLGHINIINIKSIYAVCIRSRFNLFCIISYLKQNINGVVTLNRSSAQSVLLYHIRYFHFCSSVANNAVRISLLTMLPADILLNCCQNYICGWPNALNVMSHFVAVMSLSFQSFYMISSVYHRLCLLINRTIFIQMNHSLCLPAR